jgi:integrase
VATVRKRVWKSGDTSKTAWVADYFDSDQTRRLKTFTTKKSADAWLVLARSQVASGTHTPESVSLTLAEAAKLWIERGVLENLERSTLAKYRNHVDLHITPALGETKLSRLTAPTIESFRDGLVEKLSRPMAKKVLGSLKAIITEAQRRGLVAQNVAQTVKVKMKGRDDPTLAPGKNIPNKAEINAILAKATGRWRPLFIAATFTGMRSSELRGLHWDNVDFEKKTIHVCQRADEWGKMGSPKSRAGHREIPMAPIVLSSLKEWKLVCPTLPGADGEPGQLVLVFPNGAGRVESHSNIIRRGLDPILISAGCSFQDKKLKNQDGTPVLHAKYGMHAFRHFFASWAIELGFSPKKVQVLLGHSSIQMTFDAYGHLFPSVENDQAKFAAGELTLALALAS